MPEDEKEGTTAAPDLVVLSDLHLSEGYLEEMKRYSPMEDFFHDEAFARFLDHLHGRYLDDPSKLVLVLNGDIFDFLTVIRAPGKARAQELGFKVTRAESKFGLNPSPAKSVFKVDVVVAGHRVFFEALARFVAQGHRVEMIRGNHDLELYFPEVQERLREHLVEMPGGPTAAAAKALVRFHQWFYLEPDRVYIEHGNEYEASNSIRYPLCPLLPAKRRRLDKVLLDYPLGSLFVRYFYNGVHRIDPYTPKVISFEQYLEFIRRYDFIDLYRIARDHYPFFMAALQPQTATGRSRSSAEDDARQAATFKRLEDTTAPEGLHQKLSAIKVYPMAASKLAFVQQMLKPIVRGFLLTGGALVLALYVWFLVFNLIQTPFLAESVFARTVLLLAFSVFSALGVVWLANYLSHRTRRRTDETVEMCALAADEVARVTGVKLVLMGHTHVVDTRRVADGEAVYANSGTWTSVDNPWRRLVRDARAMTFVYVKGEDIEVCRWNDNAGRIDREPLFHLRDDRGLERIAGYRPLRSIEPVDRQKRRRRHFEEKRPLD